ncbi:PREDICTED: H-2 class I histocompatibility antigen, Q10 alpha chain-like [Gekko japonicus]|uniref:H-2 class I histocompatibility antigen, Q10 alpha chain-like n=1 Tax=Gekko japonicus TaxID=146911 RepID=A0ABM1LCA0_GEKJA|nr:PREDICTED: H-2 class I histocompatibility antigen, Q10 alpha chain-like [Gekko japonicus]
MHDVGLPPRGLLLLGGVALLLAAVGCSGSSTCYRLPFYLWGTGPRPGLPEFSISGYVSNQLFVKYDSFTKRAVPQLPWMGEFGQEDSWISWTREFVLQADLVALWDCYNQKNSTGLHTWQNMYNCEVGPDGRFRRGHWQFAHDGENFIALDIKTLTWTGHDAPQDPETRRKWEAKTPEAQFQRSYLEEECVAWLQKYLDYGKETLVRTERPVVRVARNKGHDGQETLICHLYGFYPKVIYATWMKDREHRTLDTFTEGSLPNLDGTYYTWLSIEVDPKERDLYRCHVEHHSLAEPLDLAWEEPDQLFSFLSKRMPAKHISSSLRGRLTPNLPDSLYQAAFYKTCFSLQSVTEGDSNQSSYTSTPGYSDLVSESSK